jgi:molybdate transport system permease protein
LSLTEIWTILGTVDTTPIWLSIKLAGITTLILLLIATPLSWWLTFTGAKLKSLVTAFSSLPLVLPPSVLGFYMLLFLGSNGPLGKLSTELGIGTLAFSFPGLVIASVIYSFPFALQPILNAFEGIGRAPLEAAATLRASPLDRFLTVALPLARPGLLTAAVMGFAHTLGEFGVILMIGGSIPGETKVLSVAIYEQVESLQFTEAHILSGGMLVFSFVVLWLLHQLNNRRQPEKLRSH